MQGVTRRQSLAMMSAAVLYGGAFAGHGAQKARRFSFGFSLYGAPGVAPQQALKSLREIGYDCVELSCLPGSATEPKALSAVARKELRSQLSDNRLTLAALMENLPAPANDPAHRANLDRLAAACELGHALSPNAPPVVETILGHKPPQWESVKHAMARRLLDWADVARKHQTVVAIKPHVGNAMHLPEQALWLLEQTGSPWIKLAYDYSHYVLRELAMAHTVAAVAPQAAFVHIKDARGTAEKFQFLLPGETGLDYARLFELLDHHGYRGAVVVEVSSQLSRRPDYDWLAAARRSFENVAEAIKTPP